MECYLIEVTTGNKFLARVIYVLITGLVSKPLVRLFDYNLILNSSLLAKLFGEA